MTISIKHAHQTAIPDDPTYDVGADEWNAEHDLRLATDKLLGRDTAGTGVVEEIGVTAPISFDGAGNITATAADLLTAIKTVDGSGSGLDADTLDGIDATSFLTEAEAAAAYQPLDADLTSWAGVTRASGFDTFTATPSSANFKSLVSDETGSGGALVFATSPTLTTPQIDSIELNHASANTLTASGGHMTIEGATVWDSGNDGSGSGLDADLLDGKNTGTSGNVVPLLDGNNTYSGTATFSSTINPQGFFVTTAPQPSANDGLALGSDSKRWADLFLADGGVINVGTTSSRTTITHDAATDSVAIAADPDNATASSAINFQVDGATEATLNSTNFQPGANDGNALGVTGTRWADLFLADGGVVDFGASGSRATITHASASDSITIAADPDNATASSQFIVSIDGTNELILDGSNLTPGANDGNALGVTGTRWADAFFADGSVIDMGASGSRATITHTAASDSITIHADPDAATASSAINFAVDGSTEAILNSTALTPGTDDGCALGSSSLKWSDCYLAVGGIYYVSTIPTLTHDGTYATLLEATAADVGVFVGPTTGDPSNYYDATNHHFRTRDGAGTEVVDFAQLGTTASAANAFLNSGASNSLLRSTSSVEFKKDVEPLDKSYAYKLMEAEPIWYRSKAEADNPDWSYYGFTAEAVAAIDPRMVNWGYRPDDYEPIPKDKAKRRQLKTGAELKPDGVMYERFVAHHHVIIKDLLARIDALEAKLTAH